MGVMKVLSGHRFQQLFFHCQWCSGGGQPDAIGNAEYMCIHGDRWLAEGGVEDYVGGLAPHSRQGFQVFPTVRDFSFMPLHQQAACLHDVLCLAIEKTDAFNVVLQSFLTQFQYGLWCRRDLEQLFRGLIDALIRCLSRENNGYQ